MTDNGSRYPPIKDYAVLGDCRTAALVSRDGSLDWLCFPRFDSPSVFGALLDADKGGRFLIRPVGEYRTQQRYLTDTNIVETVFHTAGGSCALRDLMPVTSEEEKRTFLRPDHEVIRQLEGLQGAVPLDVVYQPRPCYGSVVPRLRDLGGLGIWTEAETALLILASEVPLTVVDDGSTARGQVVIRAGERRHLALAYSEEAPPVLPLHNFSVEGQVERAAHWWRQWASQCRYQGPYRAAVIRSALALKLMTYAPSGAVIAAPTSSLPERIGGVRNWDYRYCWLRDAHLTLRALAALGFYTEADAFMGWILHASRLTWPELQVVYDVYGESRLRERELRHLEGYRGSQPVRTGNDAHGQLQLDVYGEVMAAVAQFALRGGRFDRDTAHLLNGLGQAVCRRWREPDEGIWEGRAGRFHHTHSKAMCWVALDRLIHLHDAGHVEVRVAQFRAERDAIRAEIEARGFNRELGAYTRTLDGNDLDASLLVLPIYGYVDGRDPRMQSTCNRIRQVLGRGPLIYRYKEGTEDGLPPGEAAFGICSFWAVEALARGGHTDEAEAVFRELLGYANEAGLFGEEIEPETGAALGNFPQAFTHVGLISAALTLAKAHGEPVTPAPDRHAAGVVAGEPS